MFRLLRLSSATILVLTALTSCGGSGGAVKTVTVTAGHTRGAVTSTGVVASLRQHGLPVTAVETYTDRTDPNHLLNRPAQYVSKSNFRLRGVPDDSQKGIDVSEGGSIETFKNQADAVRRYRYVKAIAKSSIFNEYDFLHGLVLLRLSSDVLPAQAKKYSQLLATVVGKQ